MKSIKINEPISPRKTSYVSAARKSRDEKRFSAKKLKLFLVRSGLDLTFVLLLLTLVTIGLVLMFSASYPNAYYLHKGDSFFFIRNQMFFAGIGIFTMFMLSKINYRIFEPLSGVISTISFVLLGIVLLMPKINGVHRWIQLGPLSFQPSEIAKFAVVVSFASIINKNFDKMDTFRHGILPLLNILLPTLGLLILEPHFSCSIITTLLCATMMLIGGANFRWFGGVFGVISVIVSYMIFFTNYASNRISGWLHPFNPPLGVDTWQTRQGLYAIGSGGILGLGLGNSRQKYLYIPEPQNDFIFAVVCEELGFVGAVITLALFAMLIWRGAIIAVRARDRFGTLLGIGLMMQVGLQALLNVAVVTNTIPNTGISLPFFSYGGTSLFMLLAQMGVILSISRTSPRRQL